MYMYNLSKQFYILYVNFDILYTVKVLLPLKLVDILDLFKEFSMNCYHEKRKVIKILKY